jgi:hypothetical protein
LGSVWEAVDGEPVGSPLVRRIRRRC